MTRWINADELKKLFATECATECDVCMYHDNGCHCMLIDEAATTNDVKEICVANVTFDKKELEKIVNEQVIEKIKTGELALQDNRKTGEWKIYASPVNRFYQCSCCGKNSPDFTVYMKMNYCPNCGARMEEPAT